MRFAAGGGEAEAELMDRFRDIGLASHETAQQLQRGATADSLEVVDYDAKTGDSL